MPAYASFDDWFQEMEGYGLRAERYYEDCENGAESKVMTEWVRTAWQLGAAAERERCCQLVYGHASSDNAAERTVRAIRASDK